MNGEMPPFSIHHAPRSIVGRFALRYTEVIERSFIPKSIAMDGEGEMKRILVIGTGGTIASQQGENGLTPQLEAEALLRYVPEVRSFAQVEAVQLMNLDSTNIQVADWLRMSACIQAHYSDYDGFVISHGTDTMAYTAAALSYLVQNSGKPIVITGAQKPIDLDITDARTNLRDSIRFAACDRAHNVNLVFDGKVICGTRAHKERSKSYNAFASINFPYIAIIQEERILFYVEDRNDYTGDVVFSDALNPSVGLIKLIPSLDPQLLRMMGQRYQAIIIESFGVGGLPTYDSGDYRAVVSELVEAGKTVIMTTQVTLEGSNMSIYEVGKSIKDELALIESYDMALAATVTKLMWILGMTSDPERIKALFYTPINRDLLWIDSKAYRQAN